MERKYSNKYFEVRKPTTKESESEEIMEQMNRDCPFCNNKLNFNEINNICTNCNRNILLPGKKKKSNTLSSIKSIKSKQSLNSFQSINLNSSRTTTKSTKSIADSQSGKSVNSKLLNKSKKIKNIIKEEEESTKEQEEDNSADKRSACACNCFIF